jgi:hypothetical protein
VRVRRGWGARKRRRTHGLFVQPVQLQSRGRRRLLRPSADLVDRVERMAEDAVCTPPRSISRNSQATELMHTASDHGSETYPRSRTWRWRASITIARPPRDVSLIGPASSRGVRVAGLEDGMDAIRGVRRQRNVDVDVVHGADNGCGAEPSWRRAGGQPARVARAEARMRRRHVQWYIRRPSSFTCHSPPSCQNTIDASNVNTIPSGSSRPRSHSGA